MFQELNRGTPSLPTPRAYRELTPLKRREMREGLLFISPWLIGFFALHALADPCQPWLQLHEHEDHRWHPERAQVCWTGQLCPDGRRIRRYRSFGSGTRGSLWITVLVRRHLAAGRPVLPLFIALLMNSRHLKGKMAFRSAFYMPYIIPFVAAVFLWGGMLNPETGWINRALIALGVPGMHAQLGQRHQLGLSHLRRSWVSGPSATPC